MIKALQAMPALACSMMPQAYPQAGPQQLWADSARLQQYTPAAKVGQLLLQRC